ncbi:calcium-binding protein [Pelagibius sp.]|uniref:calcium-binding protein n=1 Tax=Pelagibius sp. TaxID=1931238 RepID=UPI002602F894|nr:calcium-binding protein [Pelagibius sp.]
MTFKVGVLAQFAAALDSFLDDMLRNGGSLTRGWERYHNDRCFSAETAVLLASGEQRAIRDIAVGDIVAGFDAAAAAGRGAVQPKRVARKYENVTQEFIRLEFPDGRDAVYVTPGHAFLDETGGFTKIGDLLRLGGRTARIVDADGSIVTTKAEFLRYGAESAGMFEQSATRSTLSDGNTVFKQNVHEGWKTYNFEVEDFHTYIAGGVRVHNDSGPLGELGDSIDNAVFDKLGPAGDALGDLVNTGFHVAGEILSTAGRALGAIGAGLKTGFERFSEGDFLGGLGAIAGGFGNAIKEIAKGIVDIINEIGRGIEDFFESLSGKKDSNDPKEGEDGQDGSKPIILNLDGGEIEITALEESTHFAPAGDEGLLHKTAWAAAGNGVLFYDPNGYDAIQEKSQYIFTEWDPAADSDIEALASAFDKNSDGVFDASDPDFTDFKVMVTNADGSTTVMTLTELGIVSLNLDVDATSIELPDGSHITGQTTFTLADGTTGKMADTTLAVEAQGYDVEQVASTDAEGNTVVASTGYDAGGAVAFVITAVTSPDGSLSTRSFDDNGDGAVDRIQTVETTSDAQGVQTKTVTNYDGADQASAILIDQAVTTTSADGKDITIERDSTGGGWFDSREDRSENPDGSRSVTKDDLAPDGSVIRSTTQEVSADGLTRTTTIDRDGDGATDLVAAFDIDNQPNGVRVETETTSGDYGNLLSQTTTTENGDVKTIAYDSDGDGVAETVAVITTTGGAGEVTTSTHVVEDASGNTLSETVTTLSGDTLSKTIVSDINGDEAIDWTDTEVTVIDTEGNRETTTTRSSGDGTLLSNKVTTLGADKITAETRVDLDLDGIFGADEILRSVTVDDVTGEKTDVVYDRNANGSINAESTTTTDAAGLQSLTLTDSDNDNDIDLRVLKETLTAADGVVATTTTVSNGDNSLRSSTVEIVSADGLTVTTEHDRDGDTVLDRITVDTRAEEADGSTIRVVTDYAGDGVTKLSQITLLESADRRTTTEQIDKDGDGMVDVQTVTVTADDGSTTATETTYTPLGNIVGTAVVHASAAGDEVTTTVDANNDGVAEATEVVSIEFDNLGTTTTTTTNLNDDGSTRDTSVNTVNGNNTETTVEVDADGDSVFERITTTTATPDIDGSWTTVEDVRAQDTSLLGRTETWVSGDGQLRTVSEDRDGDAILDLETRTETVLEADGDTVTTTEVRDLQADALRSAKTVTQSGDGRSTIELTDSDGDGGFDRIVTTTLADNGTTTKEQSVFKANGDLSSRSRTEVDGKGLVSITKQDKDGDGVYETVIESVTELFSDGSQVETTNHSSENEAIWAKYTTITGPDGWTVTKMADLDNDGVIDQTTVITKSIAADGTETEHSLTTSVDGTTVSETTRTVNADKSSTLSVRSDGNPGYRLAEFTDTSGALVKEKTYLTTGGTQVGRETEMTSADDLRKTWTRTDEHGQVLWQRDETTSVAEDGSTLVEIQHGKGHNGAESLGAEKREISDDGFTIISQRDYDKNGNFEIKTTDTTVFETNGEVVRTLVTQDASNQTLSETTTTTSGNGLVVTTEQDFDGDGDIDKSDVLTQSAAGGSVRQLESYGPGNSLLRAETITLSDDGLTKQHDIDEDGDTFVDRVKIVETDAIGGVTTTLQNLNADGSLDTEVVISKSANGMNVSYAIDLDGNGVTDITRSHEAVFDNNGNRITTSTESYDTGVVGYERVTTASADGLTVNATLDTDGDGVIDGNASWQKTLMEDGSTEVLEKIEYSDGDLASKTETVVSADGQRLETRSDYDGNGYDDSTEEKVTAADGSVTATEKFFDESGVLEKTWTTETSADGLVTTVSDGSVTQVMTRSAIDPENSYTWYNGVENTNSPYNSVLNHYTFLSGWNHLVATHHYDPASGLVNWRVEIKHWKATEKNDGSGSFDYDYQTLTYEHHLDSATIARLKSEAADLFDVALDRALSTEEEERVALYIVDGELDKEALAEMFTLDGSTKYGSLGEFYTRYGDMSGAQFVHQMYLNGLGRAPSLSELDEKLTALADGSLTRSGLIIELAESAEHAIVGNTQMLTNNLDLLKTEAVFERSLDEAYVKGIIQDLFDTIYDRDATTHELEVYAERLLGGTESVADLAQELMGQDRDIQGVSSSSLKGLSGAALVDQVFLNAFGVLPTAEQQALWVESLVVGSGPPTPYLNSDYVTVWIPAAKFTAAEFVAAVAQSVEKQAAGNGHVENPAPVVNIIDGDAGANSISGTNGQDFIQGMDGNDSINAGKGSDVIVGGLGNDSMIGSAGNDIYEWQVGDGNDTIYDGQNTTDVDRLRLLDVTSDNVTLTQLSESTDLLITIVSSGEMLTIQQQKYGAKNRGIEEIEFADGEVWDEEKIIKEAKLQGSAGDDALVATDFADVILGNEGNDTLDGNKGDDTLEGGLGADLLRGDAGSDTYVWQQGDGNDTINETVVDPSSQDVLRLLDVTSDQVELTQLAGQTHIFVNVLPSGEIITVDEAKYSQVNNLGVEKIEFANGEIWDLEKILAETKLKGDAGDNALSGTNLVDVILGGEGNDTLDGNKGDDTIEGGIGVDLLRGDAGSDTYIWKLGDGNDTINETVSDSGSQDVLHLLDVASDQVELTQLSHQTHIYVNILPSGEVITIDEGKHSQTGNWGVESIVFSDGVVWDLTDINANTLLQGDAGDNLLSGSNSSDFVVGHDGDDTLWGWSGDDTLDGGLGDDVLQGRSGFDVYLWRLGDGNDLIDNPQNTGKGDTLRLEDLMSTDMMFSKVGYNLQVAAYDTGEFVTVKNHFYPNGKYKLGFVEFADGLIWDATEMAANLATTGDAAANDLAGTGTANKIYGFEGDDTITALDGDDLLVGGLDDDLLIGGAGADIFRFQQGDGQDTISDFEDGTDLIQLRDTGLTFAELTIEQVGNDAVINYGAGSSITVSGVDSALLTQEDILFV